MKAQRQASSRTYYYELLGVERNAAEQELKKAYRKKSLQLHPDKPGGDGDKFREMKYAYDVLTDPKKRQAYDRYGEPGVKFVEGNVSAEVAQELFTSIGCCERMFLISLVTLFIGYLLLFPILLSVRWDHPKSMTFAHVFIPVWLGLGIVLSVCLCCVPPPPCPDVEEEDEEMRKEIEGKISEHRTARWGSIAIILVLSLLLLQLVLRLDGETQWSYFLVIWPWIVLELGLIGFKFWTAEAAFLMTGNDPDILPQKWQTKDWNFFIVAFTSPNFFYIAFACLLAMKMDGTKMSWWETFLPLWVEWAFGTIFELLKCGKLKSQEELSYMSDEARAREETRGTVVCKCFLRCVWLGCIVLLCLKLSHPSTFPAWIIFLPIFVIAGCFCCCLSCALCCMGEREASEWDAECGSERDADEVFPIGAVVEAHSLNTAGLNGARGKVTGFEGERVKVKFSQGEKKLKPANLKLVEVDPEAAMGTAAYGTM